jgi:predicted NACHT family NTPase
MPRLTLSGHDDAISSLAFSNDGKTLISGSADKTARIWNTASGKLENTLIGHDRPVTSVAFSPAGGIMLSTSNDQTLKFWDATTGKEQLTCTKPKNAIKCGAFCPDGGSALSGGSDQLITLWDTTTGKELRTFAGQGATIVSLAAAPDGRSFVTGAQDGTLRLWSTARGTGYFSFDQRNIEQAQADLAQNPNSADLQAVVGEWYAFRGMDAWAADLLSHARKGGGQVSPLMLARCYWKLGRATDAMQEFEAALQAATNDSTRFYLQLCLDRLRSDSAPQRGARPH